MFDPFEANSVNIKSRQILLWIFIPLILVSVISGIALFTAIRADEKSTIHPQCACRQILKENPKTLNEQPIFAVT
jgi:hypothetical protein